MIRLQLTTIRSAHKALEQSFEKHSVILLGTPAGGNPGQRGRLPRKKLDRLRHAGVTQFSIYLMCGDEEATANPIRPLHLLREGRLRTQHPLTL